jgi:hypothetical protein
MRFFRRSSRPLASWISPLRLAIINKIIADNTDVPEHRLNDSVRKLQEIDLELQRGLLASPENYDLRVARAEVAMALKKWSAAATLWQDIAGRNSGEKHLLAYHLAIALRRAGNITAAQQAIKKIPAPQRRGGRFKAENKRVEAAADAWAAVRVGISANKAFDKARYTNAKTLVRAGALLSKLRSSEVETIEAITDALVSFSSGLPVVGADQSSGEFKGQMILACGFGWSGSSVIADYFRGSPETDFPFDDTEITALEGEQRIPFSALHILRLLRANPSEGELRTLLCHFVLTTLLGLAFPSSDYQVARRWVTKSLRNKVGVGSLAKLVPPFIASISNAITHEGSLRQEQIEGALRALFSAILHEASPDAQRVVLNNCVHAYNLQLVKILPNPIAFAMFRDPRDQYVARVMENSRGRISCDDFIQRMKVQLADYHAAMEDKSISRRVHRLQFEDFVLSADRRAEIAALCGLSDRDVAKDSVRFDIKQSARNLGIYKKYEDKNEIRAIEKAFPDLLLT